MDPFRSITDNITTQTRIDCCTDEQGKYHGEYKQYHTYGALVSHRFYCHGKDITEEVTASVADINNITEEDKTRIMLTWPISFK